MPEQFFISVYNPTEGIEIDTGVDADLLKEVYGVLRGNIARCARDKRAASKTARRYVENFHTCFVSGRHIRQAEPSRIVKVKRNRHLRPRGSHSCNQPLYLKRETFASSGRIVFSIWRPSLKDSSSKITKGMWLLNGYLIAIMTG